MNCLQMFSYMQTSWSLGREFKLGWGYNSLSGHLTPIAENALYYISSECNESSFDSPSSITWDTPPILQFLAELIEESCRKYIDFCLLFDNQEHWIIHWCIRKKFDKCDSFPQYSQNCNFCISEIYYGVDLRIIVSKQGLSDGSSKVEDLLNDDNLDETQKKIPCKVLVNYDEIKEMSLGELTKYIEELKNDTNSPPDIPVSFRILRSNNSSYKAITITNSQNLNEFLHLLYCVFRKIEIKLEKEGHSNLLSISKSKEKLPTLEEAKNTYKSAKKNDFLEIYPIIKQLFYCYVDYIKDSLDRYVGITEGDCLPEAVDELKKWFQALNNWKPKCIVTCPGYGNAIQKFLRTKKYKEWNIDTNNEINQPTICLISGNVSFGFVDMEGAQLTKIPEDEFLVIRECPGGCTNKLQKWICTTCGDFVSIKDLILYCSCGSKNYEDKLLICIHESHRKWDIQKAPVLVTPVGYEEVVLKLHQAFRYFRISVFEDTEAREPYIGEANGEEHFFGFLNMNGAQTQEIPQDSKILERKCSKNCTKDIRRWICEKCGDFVRFKGLLLYCSCGSREYNDNIFICHHPTHGMLPPFEVIEEWKKSIDSVLIVPSVNEVAAKFHQTAKFKEIKIFEEPTVPESFIAYDYGKTILFGFIDMEEADPGELPANLVLFEDECPKGCTKDCRKWVCTKCGDFVSSKNFFLYCSCGSKKYREKFLLCHHPSHQEKKPPKIELLITQLQKLNCRTTNIDPKIPEAIKVLSSTSTDTDTIIRTVKELQGLVVGDTQHLIAEIVNDSQS